jgi:hypothetical protein
LVDVHRELGKTLALQQIEREKLLLMMMFFLFLLHDNPIKPNKPWFELPVDNGNAEESIALMRLL